MKKAITIITAILMMTMAAAERYYLEGNHTGDYFTQDLFELTKDAEKLKNYNKIKIDYFPFTETCIYYEGGEPKLRENQSVYVVQNFSGTVVEYKFDPNAKPPVRNVNKTKWTIEPKEPLVESKDVSGSLRLGIPVETVVTTTEFKQVDLNEFYSLKEGEEIVRDTKIEKVYINDLMIKDKKWKNYRGKFKVVEQDGKYYGVFGQPAKNRLIYID